MEMARYRRESSSFVGWIIVFVLSFLFLYVSSQNTTFQPNTSTRVHLRTKTYDKRVVMDNGLVQVTISIPEGHVIGIKYNGIDNILETKNKKDNRGYWDVVWNKPGEHDAIDKLAGTIFTVVREDENQVELSFLKPWNYKIANVGVNVDKRYVMLRDSPGFYSYAIFERPAGWPEVEMDQIRAVFKLQESKFRFMAVADNKMRIMPLMEDRLQGKPLAYPEAVLLKSPANPKMEGEVDDKYMYSCDDKDNKVHGWISNDPPVGFWMITPSDEFRSGGPVKQDLTSHVGPITLSMFVSTHYAGIDAGLKFAKGEPWKKVFGPIFVYLNSVAPQEDPILLWDDAKKKMWAEIQSWPYNFPESKDFPGADQRGEVSGQLLVRDKFISEVDIWARYAYVGLAFPGEAGSWQTESKGYQFWTQTDDKGYFYIKNVRAGDYNLYAWVTGFIGDYKYATNITIQPGSKIRMGSLIYELPRYAPTLWEIGIPDRTAAEFYIPDPNPNLVNPLLAKNPEKFRQYGLWERYADFYPKEDQIFTVGVSNYSKDWFFAHVNRKTGDKTYEGTTWRIIFNLDNVVEKDTYKMRLALASATNAELQIRFNYPMAKRPHFTTGLIGRDNAIARHGIHGLYWLYNIDVPGSLLLVGNNTIYLTQSRSNTPFQGFMYDYIRLEGPSPRNL